MSILFAKRMTRQYAKDIPRTPTNEDRLRQYRQRAAAETGNARRWKWHKY